MDDGSSFTWGAEVTYSTAWYILEHNQEWKKKKSLWAEIVKYNSYPKMNVVYLKSELIYSD
jgi:hypothetical protein